MGEGAVPPSRRRLFRRLRRALGVLEERQRIQDIGYGLLVAALTLALPSGAPWDTLTQSSFGFSVGPGIEGCDGFFFTRLQLQAGEE